MKIVNSIFVFLDFVPVRKIAFITKTRFTTQITNFLPRQPFSEVEVGKWLPGEETVAGQPRFSLLFGFIEFGFPRTLRIRELIRVVGVARHRSCGLDTQPCCPRNLCSAVCGGFLFCLFSVTLAVLYFLLLFSSCWLLFFIFYVSAPVGCCSFSFAFQLLLAVPVVLATCILWQFLAPVGSSSNLHPRGSLDPPIPYWINAMCPGDEKFFGLLALGYIVFFQQQKPEMIILISIQF